jgi:hypothetical protein
MSDTYADLEDMECEAVAVLPLFPNRVVWINVF